jgi:hypothetical protein
MDYLLFVVGIMGIGSLYYLLLIVRCIKEMNDAKKTIWILKGEN